MCTLRPYPDDFVPKQHQIRMRAVQLRIKTPFLATSRKRCLVAVTIPVAICYSEPGLCSIVHPAAVLASDIRCRSYPVCSFRQCDEPFIFEFSQDTVRTSSDFQLVKRDTYNGVQVRLNDFAAVPIMAGLRKREQQGCSQLHPKLSYPSFSINL